MTELSLQPQGIIYYLCCLSFYSSQMLVLKYQNLKENQKFSPIFIHLLKQMLLDVIKYFRGSIQQPMLKGSDENRIKIQK